MRSFLFIGSADPPRIFPALVKLNAVESVTEVAMDSRHHPDARKVAGAVINALSAYLPPKPEAAVRDFN